MKPKVQRHRPHQEWYTAEHCHISEWSNSDDDPGLSIARARVEPGVTTRWHRLAGIAERYCILEGSGRVELEGLEPQTVASGDVVLIPPDCPQRITNTGPWDLVFLAICTPRFTPAAYLDVEPAE